MTDPIPLTDGRALWAWIHRRPRLEAVRMKRRAIVIGRREGHSGPMRDWPAAFVRHVHEELQARGMGEILWQTAYVAGSGRTDGPAPPKSSRMRTRG